MYISFFSLYEIIKIIKKIFRDPFNIMNPEKREILARYLIEDNS